MSGVGGEPGRSARGLVERIGGVARLREILVIFYDRQAADPMVGFFFAGRDLGQIVDGQIEFLRWATGELRERRVAHPRDAHRNLVPILRGHFDRRLVLLREVLVEASLDPADVEAWIRLEASMRRHVVGSAPRPASG